MHLEPKPALRGVNSNLWFGSGFHFALEDYHGENKFKDPIKAFEAYVDSFEPEEVPADLDELVPLGVSMLDYYTEWEKSHAKWKTVWLDGKPLVEVQFSLVLKPLCYYELDGWRYFDTEETTEVCSWWKCNQTSELMTEMELKNQGATYHQIVFHGTFDRIVEDEHDGWWVLDYKTASSIDTGKLNLDPQISKYCWAAEQWFQKEFEGMVYVQVSKNPPHPPKVTTRGISTDKRQRTTHTLYRQALISYYGDVQKAPSDCLSFLNDLADVETENGNAFIRYDWVPRNEYSKIHTYQGIIEEGKEMLNPELAIYPNPTKDCSWDCPFTDMCLAMEEGADWQFYLDDYQTRNETMFAEVKDWQLRLFRKHRDLYPEEYNKYCKDSVDTIEEFAAGLEE
jgi:hypothetical protein